MNQLPNLASGTVQRTTKRTPLANRTSPSSTSSGSNAPVDSYTPSSSNSAHDAGIYKPIPHMKEYKRPRFKPQEPQVASYENWAQRPNAISGFNTRKDYELYKRDQISNTAWNNKIGQLAQDRRDAREAGTWKPPANHSERAAEDLISRQDHHATMSNLRIDRHNVQVDTVNGINKMSSDLINQRKADSAQMAAKLQALMME